jgi:hypothetical protein
MTEKQKAARARFKAVQAEAKKLRRQKPGLSQAQAVKQAWAIMSKKKVGAIKIIESGESKSAKVKAVYQQQRKKKGKRAGLYAGLKKVAGVKKPSEKNILSQVHKVKHSVDRLDEMQHKHMMKGMKIGYTLDKHNRLKKFV